MALRFPPVSQFLERFRAVLRRRSGFDFDAEVDGLSRIEQAVAFLALLELRQARARSRSSRPRRSRRFAIARAADAKGETHGTPAPPDHRRARSTGSRGRSRRCSSSPRSRCRSTSCATAANDDSERVETALGLLGERYREGRSGIVLEHVAGGWAFRASREAAEACARLFERPVERGLSPAALETLAIVAYLGPVHAGRRSRASAASPPTRSSPAWSSAA